MLVPNRLRPKLERIKLLGLDVDGVLTDGRIYYGSEGEDRKAFFVRDGLGLRLLRSQEIIVVVITARRSPALTRRMQDLQIRHFHDGTEGKLHALQQILAQEGLSWDQAAFVGDDLLDLPVLRKAGLSVTVADGHPLIQAEVDWVTSHPGGLGAVREVADAILESQGRLGSAVETLLGSAR